MPSPIPVTRLLPRDFGLDLGACSSPMTKGTSDRTPRLRTSAFRGKVVSRLWSSVIHWRELQSLEPVGSGGFGSVFKASYFGETVAVKHVRRAKNKLASRQSFWAELNAAHLRHDNLVRVVAASTVTPVGREWAREDHVGTVVMEFAGRRNLQHVIYGSGEPLCVEVCARYAADVARALRHLHGHGVVHLDVKPANVLVTDDGVCKLADFGCSLKLNESAPRLNEIGGTYTHRAPELLRGGDVTPLADVYSFGITFWQLLTREPPYEGERQHVLYAVVAYHLRPDLSKGVFGQSEPGRRCKELVIRCWSAEPRLRPTSDQLVAELSELMLCTHPTSDQLVI